MKNIAFFLGFVTIVSFYSCKKVENSGPGEAAFTKLNVPYGADGKQVMDIYLPAGRSSASTKVMIMIHGGGWSEGDKSDFTSYVDTVKRRLPDYAIFNINYRLADINANTNGFPTQENDVKTALGFIKDKTTQYIIGDKYVLLGASAGGHLALLQAYKNSNTSIKAVVNFFGPSDMKDMYNNPASPFASPASIALLLSGTPTSNPTLYYSSSPINFVSAQSAATITFQGGQDFLVRPQQQATLHNKLQANAVVNKYVLYPTESHGWVGATLSDSFNQMQTFLNSVLP